jgi:hypothetical protein
VHRALGLRNELQGQHRQGVVVRGVGKRQRACVADLKRQPRITTAVHRVFDVNRGEVETLHAFDLGISGKAGAQASGAATDVEHASAPPDAGEGDEERRKPAAPSSHLPFVAVTISGDEC